MAQFTPAGVCATKIDFEVKDGKVFNVAFTRGCNGNGNGIGRLVEGMAVDEVINRLKNVKCGDKRTSCPAQLAAALEQYCKA